VLRLRQGLFSLRFFDFRGEREKQSSAGDLKPYTIFDEWASTCHTIQGVDSSVMLPVITPDTFPSRPEDDVDMIYE
jgi:hypothetical protein